MATGDPVCPHCKREQSKFQIGRHQPNCPEKPENRAKILRTLQDPQNPGYALSERRYAKETGNSPCANTLMKHYGTWRAVAAAYGLELMHVNERRMADKMAETQAIMLRLSQRLHGGKYGPTKWEYEREAAETKAGFEVTALYRRWHDWAGILQHFGYAQVPVATRRPVQKEEPEIVFKQAYWQSVELPLWSLSGGFR